MENKIRYLLYALLIGFSSYSQEIINDPVSETNEAMQQISSPAINDIMSFQSLDQGTNNLSFIQQNGHQNVAIIHQQVDPDLSSSNQSFGFQEGNANEMKVGQIGKGNVLLGFQIGNLSTMPNTNFLGIGFERRISSINTSTESNAVISIGENNKLQVIQDGNTNGILAIQQGSFNFIDVEQKGTKNYLSVLQKGNNNVLNGYNQENTGTTVLGELVTQTGEHLSLLATGVSGPKIMGNVFNQSGTNLSLEVNNELVNTMGGIEINQTGRDMKVVVDQSYFSFPMD